jgi:hypothetical protein
MVLTLHRRAEGPAGGGTPPFAPSLHHTAEPAGALLPALAVMRRAAPLLRPPSCARAPSRRNS